MFLTDALLVRPVCDMSDREKGIRLSKKAHQRIIFIVGWTLQEAALNNLARKVGKEVEIAAAVKAKGSLKAFNITFK